MQVTIGINAGRSRGSSEVRLIPVANPQTPPIEAPGLLHAQQEARHARGAQNSAGRSMKCSIAQLCRDSERRTTLGKKRTAQRAFALDGALPRDIRSPARQNLL